MLKINCQELMELTMFLFKSIYVKGNYKPVYASVSKIGYDNSKTQAVLSMVVVY